ncbi:MAG: anaerobic ribonucleoside-triphosphate reductase activating protein [Bacteroidaceae bacterium]|jgi:anaerobic ribonucleoside-triphosphate reductase activating protein|nr:anaerobic ribonucleoside-triphosphate reductase activating protein [Bacteroidaceae bacterium]
MTIRILNILHDTTVDGPGFRTSIYCAGCRHHCPGCHNPESWDFSAGYEVETDQLMQEITADPFADVTFTGGDPFFQAEGFAELARRIKTETTKTIWCYTGFLYEHLLEQPRYRTLLEQLDVLVDGPFIMAQRNEDLLFRGSANQRLIDVPASLKAGTVVPWQRETLGLL